MYVVSDLEKPWVSKLDPEPEVIDASSFGVYSEDRPAGAVNEEGGFDLCNFSAAATTEFLDDFASLSE